jgi:hypothetical protein
MYFNRFWISQIPVRMNTFMNVIHSSDIKVVLYNIKLIYVQMILNPLVNWDLM